MKKIGLVSLGCAKNLVDSEMILAMFSPEEYILSDDPSDSDLIIVNTCGFIEDAKREAIETILEMAQYKKAKLCVVGCFVERDLEDLRKNIPEVDLWIPLKDYSRMNVLLEKLLDDEKIAPMDPLKRVISTPKYSAYLRISEGCNNFCSFCAIPYIRGRFVSRPYDEVLKEAKMLKERGVKEVVIVSQDTTMYGFDFPEHKPNIFSLLKEIDDMGFYSIRLLYLYPDEISDELLTFIKGSKSIDHYFDIPIQCASDHLLKLMKRHGTAEQERALFHKIREMMPEAILRTTLISGFPGETEEDQKETLEFMEEVRFDHLGDFPYSREEGTAAYSYPDQLSAEIKNERHDEIMSLQRKISHSQNVRHEGEVMEGLVTGYDPTKKLYTLRSYWNAPDDIDGNIYFSSEKKLNDGDIVKVKITSAFIYDLLGKLV
ncbi:MAG: 30S ribosomal protein S12 methylthiotransferase RimO [Bacilli bacterium]|jgi:ribosomal protein S12 methylthiotransferase|nr:30S ribosomal protein S12 methylthiotransferase RimO [Bacilli bacterium]MCH4211069.1 30S ribosomal protein S12 methylthiotransferase RimO [Bacilli bacterium]MCH4277996.1 30S ribosomal protein S12 methylthiotransferase RimO [Bacilli bacterium]